MGLTQMIHSASSSSVEYPELKIPILSRLGSVRTSDRSKRGPANLRRPRPSPKPASSSNDSTLSGDSEFDDHTPDIHGKEMQNDHADQLASFLSRLKYLHDEGEVSNEANQAPSSPASNFADQPSLMKAQANKVRNQLHLKFSSLAFVSQLDKIVEVPVSDMSFKYVYNPLQTIRDRNRRSQQMKGDIQSSFMWQISVREQIQDVRWRYQTARNVARKFSSKYKKKGLLDAIDCKKTEFDLGLIGNLPCDILQKSPQSDSPQRLESSDVCSNMGSSPACRLTGSLPKSESTELIRRLKSSHDDPEGYPLFDGEASDINGDWSTSSTGAPGPETRNSLCSAKKKAKGDSSTWQKMQFCRNSASIADTWNRLYRPKNNGQPQDANGIISDTDGQESCMSPSKPPSLKRAISSSNLSQSSRSLNGDFDSDHNNLPVPSSFKLQGNSSNSSVETANRIHQPLLLTVASENGSEPVLDGGKVKRKSSSPFLPKLLDQNATESKLFKENGKYSGKIEAFGSYNTPGPYCDPSEKIILSLEAELRYLLTFYQVALRHPDPCKVIDRSQCRSESAALKDCTGAKLPGESFTDFLKYLGQIEAAVVSQQQSLDTDVAASLDSLRVTTDLMVSEVNTTLNRQIREVASRMERLNSCRECAVYLNLGYSIIEYAVLFILWIVWCLVKLFKLIKSPVQILSILSSNLIVG